MSYLVLARKWRPQTFEEIVGQPHVVTTLKNAITMNRVAHAYLLSGPRGVGKTSTARVFAKALNCKKAITPEPCNTCVNCTEIAAGSSMDILEIDGASNRGIDQVRELRDNVKFAPASGRFKVYIIDEVHMLTQEAFNALLKTLEEPPSHVKFVFATTEIHKVPATILSRCQRFDLRKISTSQILNHLKEMVKKEKVKADEKILFAVAKMGDGSLRDAESLLDQLISFSEGHIKYEEAMDILGCVPREKVLQLVVALKEGDWENLFENIRKMDEEGKDLSVFVRELGAHLRDLLILQMDSKQVALVELSPEDLEEGKRQTQFFSRDQLLQMLEVTLEAEDRFKNALSKRFLLEALSVRLFLIGQSISLETLISKIDTLGNLPASIAPSVKNKQESPVETLKKNESFSITPRTNSVAPGHKHTETWGKFLVDIGGRKPLLHAYLREGMFQSDGIRLQLIFPQDKAFFLDSLKAPENQKVIREGIQKTFGNEFSLEFVLGFKSPIQKMQEQPNKVSEPSVVVSSDMAIQDDPIVQKALEIFEGKITEIKK